MPHILEFPSYTPTVVSHPIVTDLTICISPSATCDLDPRIWYRLPKDLHLYTLKQSAWLFVAVTNVQDLAAEENVVIDVKAGEQPPDAHSNHQWESRSGGIWVLRGKFSGSIDQAVTEIDVLFGADAVDPRPRWTLTHPALQLDAPSNTPEAKLTVLHGRAKPSLDARVPLRVDENGKFKIVQISDTHMVTGVGVCRDAIDAQENPLPESEADPLTVSFMEKLLDIEKPQLVVFTGDQLHHDIPDSQSALFKVVSAIIKRSIPFAAVFGNHDSEGAHALPRTAQMSILQDLPFSLCESGPQHIDGVGNYILQILGPSPSQHPFSTLYFMDSHGQIPRRFFNPDYKPIQKSQIDWFVSNAQAQRNAYMKDETDNRRRISLAFFHIPLPEFGDRRLRIRSGHRREPTEGPRTNSHFYDAMVRERISAIVCGHDHVNDFCALLPRNFWQNGGKPSQPGPWLCYGGGGGFGGYCSYGKRKFHRRMRVWELDANTNSLKTWKRVEYATDRVDELLLVEDGAVVDVREQNSADPNQVPVRWLLIISLVFFFLLLTFTARQLFSKRTVRHWEGAVVG